MKTKPWTEAHRREAREALVIETFRMMRGLSGDLDYEVRMSAAHDVSTEQSFREYMAGLGLDAARIGREVRRVDRLARGVLVRETVWCVRWTATRSVDWPTLGKALAVREEMAHVLGKGRICRVTRIRRAP